MNVLDHIRYLQEEKRAKRIYPYHITFPELVNAVGITPQDCKSELRRLYECGEIEFVYTVNNFAVKEKIGI